MINDVFSRSGKASDNMHLQLAKVKKMKKEVEEFGEHSSHQHKDRKANLNNSKTIVSEEPS